MRKLNAFLIDAELEKVTKPKQRERPVIGSRLTTIEIGTQN